MSRKVMKNCLGGDACNGALALRAANPVVSVKKRFLLIAAQAAQSPLVRFGGSAPNAVEMLLSAESMDNAAIDPISSEDFLMR